MPITNEGAEKEQREEAEKKAKAIIEAAEEFVDALESLIINVTLWKMSEKGVIPEHKEQYLDKVAYAKADLIKLISQQ